MALLERNVAARERILGLDHPGTLLTRDKLANVYLSQDSADRAIETWAETLRRRERSLGPDHWQTVAARGELIEEYVYEDRLADAIRLSKQCLADEVRRDGPDGGGPDTISRLATLLERAGRHAEAAPLWATVAARLQRTYAGTEPATRATRERLAAEHIAAGRPADAIGLYRQTVADSEQACGSRLTWEHGK